MEYTTQMDAAKLGIITEEMKAVAKKENVSPEYLMDNLAKGTIIIPANRNHPNLDPAAIGQGLKTKVNANIGIIQG